MKLKNIYFISLALISGMFSGCADDTENFDNQLFMTSKTPTTFFVKAITQNATGEFSMSIPKPSEHGYHLHYKKQMQVWFPYMRTLIMSVIWRCSRKVTTVSAQRKEKLQPVL